MSKRFEPVTIYDLECTAKDDLDGQARYKIRGEFLEVVWYEEFNNFVYKWGKNVVPRNVAIEVLQSQ